MYKPYGLLIISYYVAAKLETKIKCSTVPVSPHDVIFIGWRGLNRWVTTAEVTPRHAKKRPRRNARRIIWLTKQRKF